MRMRRGFRVFLPGHYHTAEIGLEASSLTKIGREPGIFTGFALAVNLPTHSIFSDVRIKFCRDGSRKRAGAIACPP